MRCGIVLLGLRIRAALVQTGMAIVEVRKPGHHSTQREQDRKRLLSKKMHHEKQASEHNGSNECNQTKKWINERQVNSKQQRIRSVVFLRG